ncbi:hypothetical protein FRC04_002805 [Tulasnella sp. 424]|nr:hypothetical protein FRC04_002805 [Tulasnella sp. 424]
MAETTEAGSPALNQLNLKSAVEDLPTLPAELWHVICHCLQLDMEAEILETCRFETPSYYALRRLGQTSWFFYQLTLSIRSGVIFISAKARRIRLKGRLPESSGNTLNTAFLVGYDTSVMEAMKNIPGPRQLLFKEHIFFERNVLDWATIIPTVTSLTLRGCGIDKGNFPIAPHLTTAKLYSLVDLRKSNIKNLNLDYPYSDNLRRWLPPALALLALIPSLENLTATARSFRSIGQLPTTLDLPPLRTLVVVSHLTGSINQTHILSFLRRCSTLETLHISGSILSKALEPGEAAVNMPNLKEYDGRPEYLTLIHSPALRRVVVRSLQWDAADSVIRSLASMAPDLETVVLELAVGMDSPVINSIGQWVEEAAGRWSPHWRSTERFSLVIRTAPLGEWIYSAKVGRAESGEISAEYYSRREESLAYLATSAN